MATKPILFNTEMVQAILAGYKTVTRRVIKPQPKMQLSYISAGYGAGTWDYPPKAICEESGWAEEYSKLTINDKCQNWTPPCHCDDILYVRETWAEMPYGYVYKADGEEPEGWDVEDHWHPSIHMPKEAARIFLEVAQVGVQRLQDIGEAGTRAEGADTVAQFAQSWDSTIKPKDSGQYGWDANPWVWVVEFNRCEKLEEDMR